MSTGTVTLLIAAADIISILLLLIIILPNVLRTSGRCLTAI